MTTAKDVMKLIKDNDVKYADFRFTDPRGKWQHVTFDISLIEEETFAEGQMFDGSSIAGWKAIHESDMCLMPDPASACIDPFFAETTLVLVCDVLEPTTGEPYNRDPRGIARKAEAVVEKHHHEVASAQHELGLKFSPLTVMADRLQIYKYCITQVAQIYGKTATFMPKPIYGDNGSGMHCHQSIWKDGKPVFAGNKYSDLSETCLSYIAGIIKHAKAINAFTNPTTNSYKRLVPGFEAPVLLAYSARNRSASCRIPWTSNPKAKRVEVRFPDPLANPYLAFAAMLMAGLDGIANKIDPGPAMDKDLYDLPPRELKKIPTVCGSLREALASLDKDRSFLKAGDVFSDDFIDSYIELKMAEVQRFEMTPHPVEFDMYYSY